MLSLPAPTGFWTRSRDSLPGDIRWAVHAYCGPWVKDRSGWHREFRVIGWGLWRKILPDGSPHRRYRLIDIRVP